MCAVCSFINNATSRQPRDIIVEQGLHPHPGPARRMRNKNDARCACMSSGPTSAPCKKRRQGRGVFGHLFRTLIDISLVPLVRSMLCPPCANGQERMKSRKRVLHACTHNGTGRTCRKEGGSVGSTADRPETQMTPLSYEACAG